MVVVVSNIFAMFIETKFDKVRDIAPTTPGLAVNMTVAIESGVVFDTGTIGEYNDLDDPSNIKGRIRDAFEAVDAQRGIFAAQIAANKIATEGVNPDEGKTE